MYFTNHHPQVDGIRATARFRQKHCAADLRFCGKSVVNREHAISTYQWGRESRYKHSVEKHIMGEERTSITLSKYNVMLTVCVAPRTSWSLLWLTLFFYLAKCNVNMEKASSLQRPASNGTRRFIVPHDTTRNVRSPLFLGGNTDTEKWNLEY